MKIFSGKISITSVAASYVVFAATLSVVVTLIIPEPITAKVSPFTLLFFNMFMWVPMHVLLVGGYYQSMVITEKIEGANGHSINRGD